MQNCQKTLHPPGWQHRQRSCMIGRICTDTFTSESRPFVRSWNLSLRFGACIRILGPRWVACFRLWGQSGRLELRVSLGSQPSNSMLSVPTFSSPSDVESFHSDRLYICKSMDTDRQFGPGGVVSTVDEWTHTT